MFHFFHLHINALKQQNYWIYFVVSFLNSSKSLLFEKEILICQEEEKYGTQIRMLNRMIFPKGI